MAQMQVTDITELLKGGQSPDANVRKQAEQQLQQFQEQSYAGFLLSLCAALAGEDKPLEVRRLAGIILKNTLDAKDKHRKEELAARWVALDPSTKLHVRTVLLGTLSSEVPEAGHTAAMVIPKIAIVELPRKEWNDLIPSLLQTMGTEGTRGCVRQCTLEALGYVCEEIGMMSLTSLANSLLSQDQVNNILTAVVSGMTKDEADNNVRLAATTALFNALEFAHNNFDNETERNYLMQVICEGTICTDVRVRVASLECLVKIASDYYEVLPTYMTELYKLTVRTIQQDEEDVAKQAIEFWSTLCDEEIDIIEEREAAADDSLVLHNFIKQACPSVVPVLLDQLTKQDEEQEIDDSVWSISMAAGTCLCLVANCVGNDVVPLVMPYVQGNINKNSVPDDWRLREAATFAFGSILEGPSVDQLSQLVNMGLQFLLNATKDPSAHVRNTTAWTIGRIFEFVHGSDTGQPLITNQNLPHIVKVLLESIQDEPHIANRVCYAISHLAAGSKDSESSKLSPFFKDIVQELINTAFRPMADSYMQSRLQNSSFEAINDMVRSSSKDCLEMVGQLIPLFLQKLIETFQMAVTTAESREKQSELQGRLCGCLSVVIQRLSDTDGQKVMVVRFADQIMDQLLQVLSIRSSAIHEEAMLAVGSLTFAVGRPFVKYMEKFYPFLEMGLRNHKEWQVCQSTVGTVSDVCRILEDQALPWCDSLMNLLSENLACNSVHRSIKPNILSAFSDIAMGLGEHFEKYLAGVAQILKSAMELSLQGANSQDEDFCEYNNQLRAGIIDAFSGILQGLGRAKAEQHLQQQATFMIDFIGAVMEDANKDATLTKLAVGLLGDIASALPSLGPFFTSKPWIKRAIEVSLQAT
eukprot:evm.model.scf_992.7 EVM.evm.TU.scf_992.7   scf_992:41153-48250(-)